MTSRVTILTDRRTNRWRGITTLGFLGLAAGGLFGRPGLLLASVLGLVFAAYARGGSAPTVDIDIERSVDGQLLSPGDTLFVRTTVKNVGDGFLPDVRIIDGVPPGVSVVDGSPRAYTALRAGGSMAITYTVSVERGTHTFEPVTVFARDASGAIERKALVEGPETTASCIPSLPAGTTVPLQEVTGQLAGPVASDIPGEGVEFHSLREYRPGDAPRRVAWDRFARTGELTTIEFNAERMATVIVAIDARPVAYVAAHGERPHAVEFEIEAARKLVAGLLQRGNRVGVIVVGATVKFLKPGMGKAHRARIREFLGREIPPVASDADVGPDVLADIRARLTGGHQIVWLTPISDEFSVGIARTLLTDGHAVTVVTPDVTRSETPGQQLARAERTLRLARLRDVGVRVVDWRPPQPLESAIAVTQRVGSP